MRVHAPWLKHGVMLDNDFYILPNSEETILGGTHQEDDWRLEPDPEDSKNIWEGCTEIMPLSQGIIFLTAAKPFNLTIQIVRPWKWEITAHGREAVVKIPLSHFLHKNFRFYWLIFLHHAHKSQNLKTLGGPKTLQINPRVERETLKTEKGNLE
ncbi:hypothetical protein CEXT_587451, partial [Caerostris extrusa]